MTDSKILMVLDLNNNLVTPEVMAKRILGDKETKILYTLVLKTWRRYFNQYRWKFSLIQEDSFLIEIKLAEFKTLTDFFKEEDWWDLYNVISDIQKISKETEEIRNKLITLKPD